MATNRHGLGVSGKSFSSAQLTSALTAIGSNVPGVSGTNELSTGPFISIEPSHEDEVYIKALITKGVIDQKFVEDVLMVDFTRPTMSNDRCDLLSFVPDLEPADRKPAKIKDALVAALEAEKPGAGSPAAQLLTHLKGTVNHQTTLSNFSAKCEARSAPEMIRDALRLRSMQTQVVYGEVEGGGSDVHTNSVFEFPSSMPRDGVRVTDDPAADSVNQVDVNARWSPVDCKLTNQYTPPPAS
jgi:hypothetical protein